MKAIVELPELDTFLKRLDNVSVGDLYRAIFTKDLLQVNSVIKSTSLEEQPISDAAFPQLDDQEAVNIFDNVLNDDTEDHPLREEPITDEYIYDQPPENRVYAVETDDSEFVDENITLEIATENRVNPKLTLNEKIEKGTDTLRREADQTNNTGQFYIETGIKLRKWLQEYVIG